MTGVATEEAAPVGGTSPRPLPEAWLMVVDGGGCRACVRSWVKKMSSPTVQPTRTSCRSRASPLRSAASPSSLASSDEVGRAASFAGGRCTRGPDSSPAVSRSSGARGEKLLEEGDDGTACRLPVDMRRGSCVEGEVRRKVPLQRG